MIQSGIYAKLVNDLGVQAQLPYDNSSPANSLASESVHFVRAPKQPGERFIVLNITAAPPAATSMDGTSELTDAEFQFDCYAADDDPNNAALAATGIKTAIQGVLENFGGTLPDGTTIQFYERPFDFDGGYEVGAKGYLSRRILRLRAFYSEAGQSGFPVATVLTQRTITRIDSTHFSIGGSPASVLWFVDGLAQSTPDQFSYADGIVTTMFPISDSSTLIAEGE